MSKQLTKAEEQVMQSLWKSGKGFLKDIIEGMPEPKPHSNTVATILKILIPFNIILMHDVVNCIIIIPVDVIAYR